MSLIKITVKYMWKPCYDTNETQELHETQQKQLVLETKWSFLGITAFIMQKPVFKR